LTPDERANLVAYLDGELPEPEAQAIATILTSSPAARREVESLQQTWELLDHLPRPLASEALTERTLTEARKIQEGGGVETVVLRAAARAVRLGAWVAASLAAFLVGFVITDRLWPNPTARLARELTIAEHLDEYRDVPTFEFLKELANSPEFGTDRED
jgi:anti-sigma factor RsiW